MIPFGEIGGSISPQMTAQSKSTGGTLYGGENYFQGASKDNSIFLYVAIYIGFLYLLKK